MYGPMVVDPPPVVPSKPPIEMVKEEIRLQAVEYGVNVDTALRIARCESNYNPLAENPYSSATGVYQFLDRTWDYVCEGDVYNMDDNIRCFMNNYNRHPGWWVCK